MQRFSANSLPLKLKTLRLEAGYSQKTFAKILGISRSALANYEVGNRRPDEKLLAKIAAVCHTYKSYFFDPPAFRDVLLNEEDINIAKHLKTLIQNGGKTLDISVLPPEHQISVLEYYDYILNQQQQKLLKSKRVYRIR